jgi:hypothetical protein
MVEEYVLPLVKKDSQRPSIDWDFPVEQVYSAMAGDAELAQAVFQVLKTAMSARGLSPNEIASKLLEVQEAMSRAAAR